MTVIGHPFFFYKGGPMPERQDFKNRVRQELIKAAGQYKQIYVDYEYLVCAKSFVKKEYYIIAAERDNFQHLTGVHANMDANSFFEKCYNGTLSEEDFDFIKKGQNEKAVKGTVRRKIKALPYMMKLFTPGVEVEESFRKNSVICSFATADGNCTLGSSKSGKARPKSLIKGNELQNHNTVDLILRRTSGSLLFNEIIVGDSSSLNQFKEKIQKIVSPEVFEKSV